VLEICEIGEQGGLVMAYYFMPVSPLERLVADFWL
jgi:hypothetical protein